MFEEIAHYFLSSIDSGNDLPKQIKKEVLKCPISDKKEDIKVPVQENKFDIKDYLKYMMSYTIWHNHTGKYLQFVNPWDDRFHREYLDMKMGEYKN